MQPLFVVLYYSSEVPVFLYCSQVKARRRQQRCMAENRPQRCLDFYLRSVLIIYTRLIRPIFGTELCMANVGLIDWHPNRIVRVGLGGGQYYRGIKINNVFPN